MCGQKECYDWKNGDIIEDYLYERLCPTCDNLFILCYRCLVLIGGALDHYGLECPVCKRNSKIESILNE